MIAKIFALGALPVAFAGVAQRDYPHSAHGAAVSSAAAIPAVIPHGSTTSTVYATTTYTVTSCAPTVTNCHAGHGPVVVTEVVPVSTTVCPIEDDEPVTSTYDASCSTSTSYSECVHTITSTVAPFVVTTLIPETTLTVTELSTEYSTCVHTVTNATKPYAATTLIPISTHTVTELSTGYSTCVHTVTNATTVYEATTVVPATTYTACPLKPTGGVWPHPAPPADTGKYYPVPAPDVTKTLPIGAPKPTGTGAWTKTADAGKAVVTAGAANFGAAGAIKMLGAAAAAAVLVL
ncbi:hypothetical protein OQA88_3291 [Cercophora sp. LCS_1]